MKKLLIIIILLFPFVIKADTTKEKEVLDIVNIERKKVGLNELVLDEKLTEDANVRAKEIVQKFSHTRPNGESCFTTLTNKYGKAGENIAAGFSNSNSVMKAWMASPGHKKNILDSEYKAIGIGIYEENDVIYWTQMFTDKVYNEKTIEEKSNNIVVIKNNKSITNIEINKYNFENVFDEIYIGDQKINIKDINITSSNKNIFIVYKKKILPVTNGTARLLINYNDLTLEIPVNVNIK